MEKYVYLRSGQVAELIQTIDEKNFLVAPMVNYYGYDGEEFEELGERIVVEEIFKKPPTEIFNKECQDIKNGITTTKKKLSGLLSQCADAQKVLQEAQNQKTDIENMIYNRSELKSAKRITVFIKKEVSPKNIENSATLKNEGIKLSTTVTIFDGEEKSWVYKLYSDGAGDYGYAVDPEYGLIIDATDEEIEKITTERAAKKPTDYFRAYTLARTPEKYLSFPLLKIKLDYLKEEKRKNIENLTKKIKDNQKELKLLKSE